MSESIPTAAEWLSAPAAEWESLPKLDEWPQEYWRKLRYSCESLLADRNAILSMLLTNQVSIKAEFDKEDFKRGEKEVSSRFSANLQKRDEVHKARAALQESFEVFWKDEKARHARVRQELDAIKARAKAAIERGEEISQILEPYSARQNLYRKELEARAKAKQAEADQEWTMILAGETAVLKEDLEIFEANRALKRRLEEAQANPEA